MKNLSNLTIVLTPVYEDLESLQILTKKIDELFDDVFFLIIDDCSVKNSITPDTVSFFDSSGEIINLPKNLGHQGAISFGLNYLNKHYTDYKNIVIMDSDGEDTPESIALLKKEIEKNEIDLIVASRKSRQNTFAFKSFYYLYKMLFFYFAGVRLDFGNFMILKKKALIELLSLKELDIHIAASVIKSGVHYTSLQLDRGYRYKGESRMNFVGLVLHGLRSLVVLYPLVTRRASFIIGFLILLLFFFSFDSLVYVLLVLHCIFYSFLFLYKNKFNQNMN